MPREVGAQVEVDRAGVAQLGADAGEPRLQEPGALGRQEVRLPPLRNPGTGLGRSGQTVAVDHHDPVEAFRGHAGGAQPRHARADHHRRAHRASARFRAT
ncbi:hypothetical protein ACI8AF_08760 [Blastococcus sp. SYSU D00669]